jgi:hypothetical protein
VIHHSTIVLVAAIFTLVFGVALADESHEERVRLQVRVTLDSPNFRGSTSSTIIAVVDEGYEKIINIQNYRLRLIVEDKRNSEYVVRLDLLDSDGAAIDSRSLLASSSKPGEFEMASDEVSVIGKIEVQGTRGPDNDRQMSFKPIAATGAGRYGTRGLSHFLQQHPSMRTTSTPAAWRH